MRRQLLHFMDRSLFSVSSDKLIDVGHFQPAMVEHHIRLRNFSSSLSSILFAVCTVFDGFLPCYKTVCLTFLRITNGNSFNSKFISKTSLFTQTTSWAIT